MSLDGASSISASILGLAWVAHTRWSGILIIGSLLIFLIVDVPKKLLQKLKPGDSILD